MATIDIDFEVFKALTLKRQSESETYNDVLRKMLGIKGKTEAPIELHGRTADDDWVVKGVRFPSGTQFRAHHRGKQHVGRVEKGALVLDGKRFGSPSSAAGAVTGTSVNGWIFWECLLPGSSVWRTIASLRES